MSSFVATMDDIRCNGGVDAALGDTVGSAAAINQAATVAAATPVFGLIGADFLAAFAATQANHCSSVAELARVYPAIGVASKSTQAQQNSLDLAEAIGVVANTRTEMTAHTSTMTAAGRKIPVTSPPTASSPSSGVSPSGASIAEMLPALTPWPSRALVQACRLQTVRGSCRNDRTDRGSVGPCAGLAQSFFGDYRITDYHGLRCVA